MTTNHSSSHHDSHGLIEVTARRFDHQQGGDWPGMRGLVIEARRHSESARVFSSAFPAVYVSDSIDVDMDDGRWPADEFLAWIDAVRPHLIEAAHRATAVRSSGHDVELN